MLRDDAIKIWAAGLNAVDPARLVKSVVKMKGEWVDLCGQSLYVNDLERIAIVGAGRAAARMAVALEETLGPGLIDHKAVGWVNVPKELVESSQRVHIHPAAPLNATEPTEECVEGTRHILRLVANLDRNDLCIVVLSEGADTLLAAPVGSVSLPDKLATLRFLRQAGATPEEVLCVRKELSAVKGGKLVEEAGAGHVVALILSDEPGDPLDVIAGAPTVAGDDGGPEQALAILDRYAKSPDDVPESVRAALKKRAGGDDDLLVSFPTNVENHVIGGTATALAACEAEAKKRGYRVHRVGADQKGEAKRHGESVASLCRGIRDTAQPLAPPACVLCGGRFDVTLEQSDQPGQGGPNQELVLAAVQSFWDDGMKRVAVVSADTDGHDGPTDAAGAVADADLVSTARSRGLNPSTFLSQHNSHAFFKKTGRALKTGATRVDVGHVCVAVVGAGS